MRILATLVLGFFTCTALAGPLTMESVNKMFMAMSEVQDIGDRYPGLDKADQANAFITGDFAPLIKDLKNTPAAYADVTKAVKAAGLGSLEEYLGILHRTMVAYTATQLEAMPASAYENMDQMVAMQKDAIKGAGMPEELVAQKLAELDEMAAKQKAMISAAKSASKDDIAFVKKNLAVIEQKFNQGAPDEAEVESEE